MLETITPSPLPLEMIEVPAEPTTAKVTVEIRDPAHYQAVTKFADTHGVRPALDQGLSRLLDSAIGFSRMNEKPIVLRLFASWGLGRREPHFEWTVNLTNPEKTIYAGGLVCDRYTRKWTIHT